MSSVKYPVQIIENMWCYSELECKEMVADIIHKQLWTNESLFVRFVVEQAFRVVLAVSATNIAMFLLPKNLYESFMDLLRILICLYLLAITFIYLV